MGSIAEQCRAGFGRVHRRTAGDQGRPPSRWSSSIVATSTTYLSTPNRWTGSVRSPDGMHPRDDAAVRRDRKVMLDRAEAHLVHPGWRAGDQLVVIMTDGWRTPADAGLPRRSSTASRACEKPGGPSSFAGANQDSYANWLGDRVSEGNTSNFTASPTSVLATQRGPTRSVREWRVAPKRLAR